MGNWGDDIDEELKRNEKIKVGLLLSFKSMSLVIERLATETREVDDKYPKNELLKIWGSIMAIFALLFSFSYSIFMIVTVLFLGFYGYAFFQLAKAWNSFKYSKLQFWGMTLLAIAVDLAIAVFVQGVLFG
jgi:hypothetical protein